VPPNVFSRLRPRLVPPSKNRARIDDRDKLSTDWKVGWFEDVMRPFHEITSDFRRRAFEIDCIDILLVQNTSEKPMRFSGKGYIRQTAEDRLTCKIFVEKTENVTQWEWINRDISGKPGTLYSPSDYFDLTVQDTEKTSWRSKNLLPSISWPTVNATPIINIYLDKLSFEGQDNNSEHSVSLHFFEETDLPLMIDSIDFSKSVYNFSVKKSNDSFTIEVRSSFALHEGFAGRVEEALRFLLARSVSWRILFVSDGERRTFHLASWVPRSSNTRLSPPIERRKSFAYITDSWEMFFLYLKYISSSSKIGYWSHCSYHLHNACESSANSLDAWSYGLSIAVEGLSALLPSKKDAEGKTLLKDMANDIMGYVGKNDHYSSLLERLRGTLNAMANEPPPDRMYLLTAAGQLKHEHVAAWKKLRNRFVHPKEIDLENLDNKRLQELMNEIHSVTVLMYHVVFYIIGYSGIYTDYSTFGFPEKRYP
jgi:hypothetical protein